MILILFGIIAGIMWMGKDFPFKNHQLEAYTLGAIIGAALGLILAIIIGLLVDGLNIKRKQFYKTKNLVAFEDSSYYKKRLGFTSGPISQAKDFYYFHPKGRSQPIVAPETEVTLKKGEGVPRFIRKGQIRNFEKPSEPLSLFMISLLAHGQDTINTSYILHVPSPDSTS